MAKPNLLTRDDTFLGICEGLGEDLRINSNLLRIAFAGALFFSPMAAIGAYLGLGVVVALTRWLVPSRRPDAETAPAVHAAAERPASPPVAQNDERAEELLAA